MSSVNTTTKHGLLPNISARILKLYSSQKTNRQDWRREIWEEWRRGVGFLMVMFPGVKSSEVGIRSLSNCTYCGL